MRERISIKGVQSEFVKKVEELSGQNLLKCYQCGKCSAGCPVVESMDILPNQVIRLAQLGLEKDILNANTFWLCASCVTCTSRCPKGVDIARIMEALRAIVLRLGLDKVSPTKLPIDILLEVPQQGLVSSMRKFSA